jgi:predicted aspartyl protease
MICTRTQTRKQRVKNSWKISCLVISLYLQFSNCAANAATTPAAASPASSETSALAQTLCAAHAYGANSGGSAKDTAAVQKALGDCAASETAATVATTVQTLDQYVRDVRTDKLAKAIGALPPGSDHDYFAGMLANGMGRTEESIRLLDKSLPKLRTSSPERAIYALVRQADNYTKIYQYGKAARTLDDLFTHFADQLSAFVLETDLNTSDIYHLLQDVPPQTITWAGPVRLKTERDANGLIGVDLGVNGVRERWVLDSGANFNIVSRSFAKNMGLKLLSGGAQLTSGLSGQKSNSQFAVIPALTMDGATLHNVLAMVVDDENLNLAVNNTGGMVNGVIGYPILHALGHLTFFHDGRLEADNAPHGNEAGTPIFMIGLSPAITCNVAGEDIPFTLDTGANITMLSYQYYNQFHDETGNWTSGTVTGASVGGTENANAFFQPQLKLGIGTKTAVLNNVPIFPAQIGSQVDYLYGNLGRDLLDSFSSFTIDLSNMKFSLGDPLPPSA